MAGNYQGTLDYFSDISGKSTTIDSQRYQDKEWLHKQYVENQQTLSDIADICGVSSMTISRWLSKHGIETRDGGNQLPKDVREKLENEEWLHEQYVENQRPVRDIANELGTSRDPIEDRLKKYNIEIRVNGIPKKSSNKLENEEWLRKQYVEKKRSICDIADELGTTTTPIRNKFEQYGIESRSRSDTQLPDEATDRLEDEEWLRNQYIEKQRSTRNIANELNISRITVRRWLIRYSIKVRSNVQEPGHLDHLVRSTWEMEIAEILTKLDVEYEYEGIQITWTGERIYTPDFVTDEYVIEVKGRVFEDRYEREKARAAMNVLDNREYVVVGTELPCDIHIPWEDRESLTELITSQ